MLLIIKVVLVYMVVFLVVLVMLFEMIVNSVTMLWLVIARCILLLSNFSEWSVPLWQLVWMLWSSALSTRVLFCNLLRSMVYFRWDSVSRVFLVLLCCAAASLDEILFATRSCIGLYLLVAYLQIVWLFWFLDNRGILLDLLVYQVIYMPLQFNFMCFPFLIMCMFWISLSSSLL